MKIKISATFIGKCSICGKEGKVFRVGDEESKKVITICEECARKEGDKPISEIVEKYGQVDTKAFKKGIRRL